MWILGVNLGLCSYVPFKSFLQITWILKTFADVLFIRSFLWLYIQRDLKWMTWWGGYEYNYFYLLLFSRKDQLCKKHAEFNYLRTLKDIVLSVFNLLSYFIVRFKLLSWPWKLFNFSQFINICEYRPYLKNITEMYDSTFDIQ